MTYGGTAVASASSRVGTGAAETCTIVNCNASESRRDAADDAAKPLGSQPATDRQYRPSPFEANRSRRVPAGILPEGHFMRVQGATAFALAG